MVFCKDSQHRYQKLNLGSTDNKCSKAQGRIRKGHQPLRQVVTPELRLNIQQGSYVQIFKQQQAQKLYSQSKQAPYDYRHGRSDEGVFTLPQQHQLEPYMVQKVFDYDGNFLERYRLGETIGQGSFGIVKKCYDRFTNEAFAVKSIPKVPRRTPTTPRYLLKLRQEVESMQQLSGSLNSVFLKDVFEDHYKIDIVMELCTGGSLFDKIQQIQLSEKFVSKQIRQIVRFVSQCHSKGIVYRDVKAENFLFLNQEKKSPLKATDFGLSIQMHPNNGQLRSRSGTPAYMAPEVILQCYNEKCDMWSVGILCYLMLTGKFPYMPDQDITQYTLQEVWKCVLQNQIDFEVPILDNFSQEAIDFMKQCLEKKPQRRISSWNALRHPWLTPSNKNVSTNPIKGETIQRIQRFATYGFLKQIILKLVLHEMQSDNQEIISVEELSEFMGKEAISEWSSNDAEGIELQQFKDAFKSKGYKLAEKEVDHLIERIGDVKDGKVNLNDVQAVLMDWDSILLQESRWHEWAQKVFKKLDIDGDGQISLEELVNKLQAQDKMKSQPLNPTISQDNQEVQSSQLSMTMAKMLLREADVNNDGLIELKEFFKLLQDPQKFPDSLDQYDPRIESIDESGDYTTF